MCRVPRKTGELPEPPIGGHTEWSGKNFRFATRRVAVVYDWDRLRLRPEAVSVGNAAMNLRHQLRPARREARACAVRGRGVRGRVNAARDKPLTRSDRERTAACATFLAAYTARCEHAIGKREVTHDDNAFGAALWAHAEEYLRP